ncbi:MAG: DUF2283 domain-containing protein [Candidatus Binataceae bacterium]
MEKIRVIHDMIGQTLTVWFDDPRKEAISQETTDEVLLMKDSDGRVIGFEMIHYRPSGDGTGLSVEASVIPQS